RGMTIELGFAGLTVGHTHFGIVDVPGHERFVRTMVAGATGIDLALIIVAADDSVMPQTREHVDILNVLGVKHAVVAITKIDLVDEEMVELVAEDVRELLTGTGLEAAPIRPVSSTTRQGLEELKQAIAEVADQVETRPAQPPFRLTIDRVFTVPGRGTVVTGSALRGSVATGDTLEVWPTGERCRVRALQTHGTDEERLSRGQRVAINVSGIDRDLLSRGSELATVAYLQPSSIMDVRLQCLPSCAKPLKRTSVVRLGLGTVEVPVRVVLLAEETLQPGQSAYAQVRSGQPLVAAYGQHFIIRDETASRTIGGGIVLRPMARRKRRNVETDLQNLRRLETGDAADRVEQVLRAAGFAALTDLQVCARAGVELEELPALYGRLADEKRWGPVAGTEVKAVPEAVDDLTQRLVAWLERYHRNHPELPGRKADTVLGWLERMSSHTLARPLFERLIAANTLKRLGPFVGLPAFAPELTKADERILKSMLDEIRAGAFQPPFLDGLSIAPQAGKKRLDRLATLAVALGELVEVGPNLYLHAEAEPKLRQRVAAAIQEHGEASVSEIRQALDSTRKYVVPFMEYLDRVGYTKRVGDKRVLAEATAQS
ncbi:MAG: selenocysteine-specific translation elongation factor, partial [Planctomycetes bacterium]|nr:selenocysteine-specific translation elongation factor [Planctomycetota bacterium]